MQFKISLIQVAQIRFNIIGNNIKALFRVNGSPEAHFKDILPYVTEFKNIAIPFVLDIIPDLGRQNKLFHYKNVVYKICNKIYLLVPFLLL